MPVGQAPAVPTPKFEPEKPAGQSDETPEVEKEVIRSWAERPTKVRTLILG